MQGRSLLPILEEENPKGWDEVYGSHVFHEITMYYPVRTIRTESTSTC
jgi:N-sulfoglucosamine sulfohydrolase